MKSDDSTRNGEAESAATASQAAHYAFAHRALPAVFRSQPLRTFAGLTSSEADAVLSAIIAMIEKAEGITCGFAASDLTVTRHRVAGWPTVVIEMPPPTEMPLAYFVGLVVLLDADQPPKKDGPDVPSRYFTLERTADDGGPPGSTSVVGGWASTGHLNFGDGGEPSLEGFLGKIEEIMNPSDGA